MRLFLLLLSLLFISIATAFALDKPGGGNSIEDQTALFLVKMIVLR